jgi:hypothetical protein
VGKRIAKGAVATVMVVPRAAPTAVAVVVIVMVPGSQMQTQLGSRSLLQWEQQQLLLCRFRRLLSRRRLLLLRGWRLRSALRSRYTAAHGTAVAAWVARVQRYRLPDLAAWPAAAVVGLVALLRLAAAVAGKQRLLLWVLVAGVLGGVAARLDHPLHPCMLCWTRLRHIPTRITTTTTTSTMHLQGKEVEAVTCCRLRRRLRPRNPTTITTTITARILTTRSRPRQQATAILITPTTSTTTRSRHRTHCSRLQAVSTTLRNRTL